ncbi:iron-sulfur cluster assembly scaffold protein [candidate division WOR-3 bacterium]|nr:iron-sulfur cluster assembly scaffold protein [candidate division WOR-3 bacterium]
MSSDFEKFAERLQEEILEDARKHYTEIVIDNWMHPRNLGKIENPDGYGKVTGSCGDTMEFFLTIKSNIIKECRFLTDGCGTSIACGSIVTELAKGKELNQAVGITQEIVLKTCGGLLPDDEHCALLASNTLIEAIRNYKR